MIGFLLLLFLASFIPAIREKIKIILGRLYMVVGAGLFAINAIMSFSVAPKLLRLYEDFNLEIDAQKIQLNLAVVFLMSILMFIIGWKYKKLASTNLKFYAMFALVIILSWTIFSLLIISIIEPIYQITNSA